jgi:hypothetical protein
LARKELEQSSCARCVGYSDDLNGVVLPRPLSSGIGCPASDYILHFVLRNLLPVFSALLALYVAGVGVWAGLEPTKKSDQVFRARIRWSALVTAILLIPMAILQAFQNPEVLRQLLYEERSQVDASIVLDRIVSPDDPRLALSGNASNLFINFASRHNTAKNADLFTYSVLMPGPPTVEQNIVAWKRAMDKFTDDENREHETRELSENAVVSKPIGLPDKFSEDDRSSLLNGTSALYVFSFAHWTNPSGSESKRSFCLRLNTFRGGSVPTGFRPWSHCPDPSPPF